MKSKLANISFAALTVLILAGILLIGSATAANNVMGKTKQVNRINTVSDQLNSLLENTNQDASKEYARTNEFILHSTELYMFFSAGGKPAYLTRKGNDHYLKFERPQVPECENTACVCYCPLKNPLWTPSDEEPYLKPTQVFIIEDKAENGFSCTAPQCKQVGDDIENIVYFGNSRGKDQAYFDLVDTQVDEGDERDIFQPIPMDISLLIQNEVKDEGNFLFSTNPGDDYHKWEQDDDFVQLLVEEYVWENGVVIGGTGFSKDKDMRNDHRLQGPPITLRMQTTELQPGIIGVCLHEDCLFEQATKELVEEQTKQKNNKEHITDARKEFLKFDNYLHSDFEEYFEKNGETQKADEFLEDFKKELTTLFDSFDTLQITQARLVISPHSSSKESITPKLTIEGEEVYVADPIGVALPHKTGSEQFEGDIIITGFENDKLELSDGTTRSIQIVLKDNEPTLYFKI